MYHILNLFDDDDVCWTLLVFFFNLWLHYDNHFLLKYSILVCCFCFENNCNGIKTEKGKEEIYNAYCKWRLEKKKQGIGIPQTISVLSITSFTYAKALE